MQIKPKNKKSSTTPFAHLRLYKFHLLLTHTTHTLPACTSSTTTKSTSSTCTPSPGARPSACCTRTSRPPLTSTRASISKTHTTASSGATTTRCVCTGGGTTTTARSSCTATRMRAWCRCFSKRFFLCFFSCVVVFKCLFLRGNDHA